MDPSTASMLAPLESPLPPPPEGEVFSPEQWAILTSILDTVVPPITNIESEKNSKLCLGGAEYAEATRALHDSLPSTTDPAIISPYLSESASSVPGFRDTLQLTFGRLVPEDQVKGLRFLLTSLLTRAGSLLMTGSATPFHLQSPSVREQILIGWSRSYVPTLRALFRSFSFLGKRTWLALSPTLPQMVGFPAIPKQGKRGQDHPYEFLDFFSSSSSSTIETDIVIVGSGCGAGVCAKTLAEAGFSVVVAEKGRYYPSTHFPMSAQDAFPSLMENGGAVMSDDASTAVLAGSTFGGGGTVNWSASLQPQDYVRQEWADQGLPFFTSAEFQKCLDGICGDMGVGTKTIQHNFANRTLLEGSRRLGYTAKEVPQNTAGREHYCGYCTFGCAGATKQGPANCFFPRAARAGAKFVQSFNVSEIEFEQVNGKKKAVGVKGLWTDMATDQKREIRVKAKRVILSAGTLNSPLLLLRSGLKNPNLGKNLHLHPATLVGARFDEVTNPWEGGILTSVTTSLENLDSKGHGVKIECQTMLPVYFLPFISWGHPPAVSTATAPQSITNPRSVQPTISPALTFKTRSALLHHYVGFVIIARDRDTGTIYPDPRDGRARLKYTTSAFDRANIVEGLIAAAKIAYVCGAREVFSTHPDLPPFIRAETSTAAAAAAAEAEATGEGGEDANDDSDKESDIDQGVNDPAFMAWLERLRYLGVGSPDPCVMGSAHQMGSCRMSANAKNGVVDSRGRVWGMEGDDEGSLYVADASVFPSASGVNPMVTNMGIAQWISDGIVREERRRRRRKEKERDLRSSRDGEGRRGREAEGEQR